MVDQLIEILSQFNFPVIRQGSLAKDDEYPDNFFTFWNNDTPDHSYYDNDNYGSEWFFNVNFYSNNPASTYSYLDQARTALRAAGWIVTSKGYDVLSDEPTHTGRGFETVYLDF